MRIFPPAFVVTTLPLLLACSSDSPDPGLTSHTPIGPRFLYSAEYYCQNAHLPGHWELCTVNLTDESPWAAGEWITQTPDNGECFSPSESEDGDADGLSDVCEYALASRFAPRLLTSTQDNYLGREEYWVARPVNIAPNAVLIGYFIGYYRDGGCVGLGCSGIQDHVGDSEAVWVVVSQVPSSNHWIAYEASFSAHTSYIDIDYNPNAGYATALEYAGVPGGAFYVYVAESKHANYPSAFLCNRGGAFGTDRCSIGYGTNAAVPVAATPNRNLGSESVQLIDCVASQGQYAGNGHTECYWSINGGFAGWQYYVDGVQPTGADWHVRLHEYGFFPIGYGAYGCRSRPRPGSSNNGCAYP